MRKSRICLVVFAMSSPLALAQDIVGQRSGSDGLTVTFPSRPTFVPSPIAGAPYSAEETVSQAVFGRDGKRLGEQQYIQKLYRDSRGRTRFERAIGEAGPSGTQSIIEITDTTAGVRYVLDGASRVAHRLKLPAPGLAVDMAQRPAGLPTGELDKGPGSSSSEALGTRMIAGVLAQGTRTIQKLTGDREIVSEIWRAPDIKIALFSKMVRPAAEITTQVTKLAKGEPDADLFRPPADYRVIDEDGPFTVVYGKK